MRLHFSPPFKLETLVTAVGHQALSEDLHTQDLDTQDLHTQDLHTQDLHKFLDGYCSTVQGLLDWFEVDLGFTELSFIQIDLCVLCDFVLDSRISLSSCPFLDILHCLPRAVGVPLESVLNLVSRMCPCGAHDTHACCARSNDHLLYLL